MNRRRGMNAGWFPQRRGRGGWSPSEITSLVLDLDPATAAYSDTGGTTPASNGGTLRSVGSSVGGLLAVASVTSFTYSTSGNVGKPAVVMDATGQFAVDSLNLTSGRDWTMAFVGRPTRVYQLMGFTEAARSSAQYFFNNRGVIQNNTTSLVSSSNWSPEASVIVIRSSGSGLSFWQNGTSIGSTASLLASGAVGNVDLFGFSTNGAYPWEGEWYRMVGYDRAITDGEIGTLSTQLAALYPPQWPSLLKTLVVCHGNSLTAGVGAAAGSDYPSQLGTSLGSGYAVVNRGWSGQVTTTLNSAAPFDVNPYYDASRPANWAVLWEITNDIVSAGSNGATAYANVQTWRTTAAGTYGASKVIVLDCLPRSAMNGTQETARTDCNASLASEYSIATAHPRIFEKSGGGLLVQVSAISDLSNPANTTYYADGTHLTAAGYALIAADVASALAL